MKFLPEYKNKCREEEMIKLKQTVFKLKALLQNHVDKQAGNTPDSTNVKIQQMLNELVQNNDWAR